MILKLKIKIYKQRECLCENIRAVITFMCLTFFILQHVGMLRMHHDTPIAIILPETEMEKNDFERYTLFYVHTFCLKKRVLL